MFSFFIQLLATDPLAYLWLWRRWRSLWCCITSRRRRWQRLLGDSTAKLRGFTGTEPRLHLDTFYLIWLAVFGFAIPTQIPVNAYAFRQGSREALVWWSGPLAMVLWAFVLFTAYTVLSQFGGDALGGLALGFAYGASRVLSLAVVFFFPVPPVAGAKAVYAVGSPEVKRWVSSLEMWMNRTPFGFMIIFVVLSVLGVTGAISGFFVQIFVAILGLFGL
ncbi:MAG: site-2 protease family protein [Pleurocapsa sp. SU_196_0]|nr:site-2 protease family protein [Pleurocapsa sp. SU_196_0]